ncbi:MAG: SagB/ThcOx family dehydrogenase [Spirochaetes bacterium]|jgi:SagB-type dehydrogenase family enzyme|nr:SagB/ThcOx family dehydrogenase [Spirochaetota bacterium]
MNTTNETAACGDGAPGDVSLSTEASTESTDAGPALRDDLAEELQHLTPEEQRTLSLILQRGQRDRDRHGPVTELSLIANALKNHIETDTEEWQGQQDAEVKIGPDMQKEYPDCERVSLPREGEPIDMTLPQLLENRRSRRSYTGEPITQGQLSTLLYQGYGVKDMGLGYNRANIPSRTVPTTGGLQCVELYVVVNDVDGLQQGLYHYHAVDHCLERMERGNFRWKTAEMCQGQKWLANSSAIVFLAPVMSRLSWKYGRRAYRMAQLDTGIVSQTLHLAAESLGLGSCIVLGFQDDAVNGRLLDLDGREEYVTCALSIGQLPPSAQVW